MSCAASATATRTRAWPCGPTTCVGGRESSGQSSQGSGTASRTSPEQASHLRGGHVYPAQFRPDVLLGAAALPHLLHVGDQVLGFGGQDGLRPLHHFRELLLRKLSRRVEQRPELDEVRLALVVVRAFHHPYPRAELGDEPAELRPVALAHAVDVPLITGSHLDEGADVAADGALEIGVDLRHHQHPYAPLPELAHRLLELEVGNLSTVARQEPMHLV